jgi:hypothetical protein
MRCWNKLLLWLCLSLLLLVAGCKKNVDPAGTWDGHIDGVNADKHGTSDVELVLENSRHGVDGTVKWHNSTGPWGLMEGETLDVRSGQISGNQVSFMADKNLPGGTVSANFKGNLEGSTFKGTVDVNIGSVMGGDVYLGNFEVARK